MASAAHLPAQQQQQQQQQQPPQHFSDSVSQHAPTPSTVSFPAFDFRLSTSLDSSATSSNAFSTSSDITQNTNNSNTGSANSNNGAMSSWSYTSMPGEYYDNVYTNSGSSNSGHDTCNNSNNNNNSSGSGSALYLRNGGSHTHIDHDPQQNQIIRGLMAESRSDEYTADMEGVNTDCNSSSGLLFQPADQQRHQQQQQEQAEAIMRDDASTPYTRPRHHLVVTPEAKPRPIPSRASALAIIPTGTGSVLNTSSQQHSQHHLNARQYVTLMSEAARDVRALASDQSHQHQGHQQQPSMLSPDLASSPSTLYTRHTPTHHPTDSISNSGIVRQPHEQQQQLHHAHHTATLSFHEQARHLALRRAQSFGAFSPQSQSSSSFVNSSEPCPASPLMALIPQQQQQPHLHHHYHHPSPILPQSPHPQQYQQHSGSQHNDYFSSMSASTSSDLPLNMSGTSMNVFAHYGSSPSTTPPVGTTMMENHRFRMPSPMPLAMAAMTSSTSPLAVSMPSLRKRPDSAVSVSSPLFSSSLSSSFLSSSSASPSPSPPSPLMFSNSPSTFSLPSTSSSHRCQKRPLSRDSTHTTLSSYLPVSSPSSLSSLSPASSGSNGFKLSNTTTTTAVVNGNKKSKARYVCQIPDCNRTFSRPFNLKSHGLTHETHRPHGCSQCPKTFARIHDRDRHTRGHLSEKAHSCMVCRGRFARQDAVTRHLKLSSEQNPCAVILKSRGISFREAAAGRVKRSVLGEEDVIRRTLEGLEEQARKSRASKNLEMGMMSINMSLGGMTGLSVNMNMDHSMDMIHGGGGRGGGYGSVVGEQVFH